MKKYIFILALLALAAANCKKDPGFLRAEGTRIVNSKGENVLLRGIGLGGWMLQEPYMLQLSKVAGNQTEIKRRISDLIGEEKCNEFYDRYLMNMVTEKDIDSLKSWGFNSVRLAMHYNLFTPPVEQEKAAGEITWLEKGFEMTDNLLEWCKKNEIYLILDLHAAPGGQGNDRPIADVDTLKPQLWESSENINKTVALWRKLAERYADEPWIGGYDLLNETNYPMEGNKPLRHLFDQLTVTIREVDKNHIIFIEGNQFANDYTGLLPPWDSNLVYSFHKYWNPATVETIQKYLDLREQYNVPIWMGEAGENNNQWFRDVIALLEANNIGWSWWTLKKIGSESGLMTIKKPEGYDEIVNFWSGNGPAPSAELAEKVFIDLAENIKIENCRVNYPVLKALLDK